VSSIVKWYGDDFIERFEAAGLAQGSAKAAALSEKVTLRILDYDWSPMM